MLLLSLGRRRPKAGANLRYAPVACPRCRRHAAIYDLKYPHRTAPPSKNPREYHFDIQDAKEYVLLKDGRRKIATLGEVIDIKPFLLSDEDRGYDRKHSWTPGSEREGTPGQSKKRARSETASAPQRDSFSKKRKQPKATSPKRQMSPCSEKRPSVGPQPSEYEKMQLLIANAEKEATAATSQTRARLRKMVSAGPSAKNTTATKRKHLKQRQPRPQGPVVVSVTQRRTPCIIVETEERVEDIQPILTSPKVAVYDEWQELVKKAQEDGEAGLARSRRTTRRTDRVHDGVAKSPRKRPRNDDLVAQHSDEVTTNDGEIAPISTSDEQSTNTSNPVRTDPAEDAFEQAGEILSPKIRRNVASLMADEIHKVKLEMACVAQGQFRSSTLPSPPYQREKPSSLARHKEFLSTEVKRVTSRRRNQSPKLPETTVLEGNRLFMFAILATEGLNE